MVGTIVLGLAVGLNIFIFIWLAWLEYSYMQTNQLWTQTKVLALKTILIKNREQIKQRLNTEKVDKFLRNIGKVAPYWPLPKAEVIKKPLIKSSLRREQTYRNKIPLISCSSWTSARKLSPLSRKEST